MPRQNLRVVKRLGTIPATGSAHFVIALLAVPFESLKRVADAPFLSAVLAKSTKTGPPEWASLRFYLVPEPKSKRSIRSPIAGGLIGT
jgi:hypothetical protein